MRSERVCEFLATAIGRPIKVPDEPELTALGAAVLAARVDEMPPMAGRSFEPGDGDVGSWHRRFGDAVRRAGGWREERA